MLADLGLTVAREVPLKFVPGVVSGALNVTGGVIRSQTGQIVAHLVSSGPISAIAALTPGLDILMQVIESGQLAGIAKDVKAVQESVQAVLGVASAGAALSGLGLVTSMAGFAYLSHRLSQVDERLITIERDVKDIKAWQSGLMRAQLQSAIDDLRHAARGDDRLSASLLMEAKGKFNVLVHHYRDQWAGCRTVQEVAAIDDLYALAMFGHANACSDLGLVADAADDLRDNATAWVAQARQHAGTMLLQDQPDRLLSAEFVEAMPARSLVQVLDFAHDQTRGIDWFDTLRSARARKGSMLDGFANMPSPMKKAPVPRGAPQEMFDLAVRLTTRSEILSANVAHYDFLQAKGLRSEEFRRIADEALRESGGNAICISAADTAAAPAEALQ